MRKVNEASMQQVLTVQRIKCDWRSYESSSASKTAECKQADTFGITTLCSANGTHTNKYNNKLAVHSVSLLF